MEVLTVVYFVLLQFHALNGLPTEQKTDQSSRQPKRLIRKIHNGVAFLAGVKVGTLLANKGFDAGHGSFAATNNFQLFGKNINSAISLSYGTLGQKLPLLDEPVGNDTEAKSKIPKEDVVHLTVVHNPSPDTIEKLKRISKVSMDNSTTTIDGDDAIIIETNGEVVPPCLIHDEKSRFREQHNKMVEQFNREIKRRNSKLRL